MNTYRVDRTDSPDVVPCGMNSIRFIGDSERQARKAFMGAATGFDPWGVKDPRYGVVLSRWNGSEYVVMARKGFAA
jgi:hypothetical protein